MKNTFENITIKEEKAYFFSYEMDGLFEIDFFQQSCKYLTSYGISESGVHRLFSNVLIYCDWLVCIPMRAEYVMAFNKRTKEKIFVHIPKVGQTYKKDAKFLSAHIIGESLYMVGHAYPGVVKINLKTWASELVLDFVNVYTKEISKEKDLFRYSQLVDNKWIIMPSAFSNDLFVFDITTNYLEKKNIGKIELGFSSVYVQDDYFWLFPLYQNEILKWNYKTEECFRYYISNENKKDDCSKMRFSNYIILDNYIVLIPMWDYNFVIIDKHTGEIKEVEIDIIRKKQHTEILPVRGCYIYDHQLYLVSGYDGGVYKLDVSDAKLYNMKKRLTVPRTSEISIKSMSCFYEEEKEYNLLDYIFDVNCFM